MWGYSFIVAQTVTSWEAIEEVGGEGEYRERREVEGGMSRWKEWEVGVMKFRFTSEKVWVRRRSDE